jgi:hypothetical protein
MSRKPGETRLDRAHKVVSTFLVPPMMGLMGWVAVQATQINSRLDKLETAVSIQIPHLQQADNYMDNRVTRLESWIFGRDR